MNLTIAMRDMTPYSEHAIRYDVVNESGTIVGRIGNHLMGHQWWVKRFRDGEDTDAPFGTGRMLRNGFGEIRLFDKIDHALIALDNALAS